MQYIYKNFYIYVSIYLVCRVLVAACEVFSCSMWDLVPGPGIEPGPPALGAQSLPLDHQASSHIYKLKISVLSTWGTGSFSLGMGPLLILLS